MSKINKAKQLILASSLAFTALFASQVHATIVQFQTSHGSFEVNLYDEDTPQTVNNFLAYVEAGDYSNTIIHRSISGFIIQGGGFVFDSEWPATSIPTNAAVVNEPVFSNVRATIAMAKIGGQPNSATSQWYINLSNNAQSLDPQNGGFTVFGEVTGDGMNFVDQISNVNTYNLGGAFTDLPLDGYTSGDTPEQNNLIVITDIMVIDGATNTAAGLNPTPTTYNPAASSSSGGGGSLAWLMLLGFSMAFSVRRKV